MNNPGELPHSPALAGSARSGLRLRPTRRELLCAALALLEGGCASERDGRTTIRYMAWGNPEQLALERKVTAEFEKRNPKIRVHLFMVPGSAYSDKLQLMLASRTAPDVMRVDHYDFPALVRKDYFLCLDPFVAAEKPGFLDDFLPTALAECRTNGKLYGLNGLFGAMMIYYNKRLLAQAGLPDPYRLSRTGRWTWDTFVAAAQAITKQGNGRFTQFGCNMVGFPLYASVVWNNGGDFMNPEMTHFTLGNDPRGIQGIAKYVDLRWKRHCAPTPADNAFSVFTFESGKIGMHWGWAGESPRFRRNIKSFNWDIAPTPSGPAGNVSVVKGNQNVIYRETKHPEAAWEFLKFLTGPENELMLCGQQRRAVPTRLSVQNDPRYLQADKPPFQTDVFLDSVRRGRTLPINWRYQEWVQEYNAAMEVLFNIDGRDAASACREAARRINTLLAGEEGF